MAFSQLLPVVVAAAAVCHCVAVCKPVTLEGLPSKLPGGTLKLTTRSHSQVCVF